MRRLLPLLLLALVACGDKTAVTPRADDSSSPPPASSLAPDGVVLRVSYGGGFVPRDYVPGAPAWSLHGDGRMIGHGPQIDIYPGPAYPNLRVWKASGDAVRWLADKARAAGVDGQKRDYGQPPVADAGSTVFHLSDERGTHDLTVYALSEGFGTTGLTEEQAANRKKLLDFLGVLGDPGQWPGSPTEEDPYVAKTVAVFARPYPAPDPNAPAQPEIAWRGPDPSSAPEQDGNRCVLVTGDTLATVMPDFARANTLTRWTHGAGTWAFTLRPLLPDEKHCPGSRQTSP